MDFSPSALAAGLVLSAVGLGLFLFGKAQKRPPQFVAGVLMMLVPLFGGGWLQQISIGCGLGCAMWLALRLDL